VTTLQAAVYRRTGITRRQNATLLVYVGVGTADAFCWHLTSPDNSTMLTSTPRPPQALQQYYSTAWIPRLPIRSRTYSSPSPGTAALTLQLPRSPPAIYSARSLQPAQQPTTGVRSRRPASSLNNWTSWTW
jgi:hypothetical protein